MEYAKKMVVVPEEVFERMRDGPPTQRGRVSGTLDSEMHRILNDKRLDDSEKWKQYQQVLQRFLHFSAAKRRGIGLPIFQEGDDDGEGDTGRPRAQRQSAALVDEVVETFPKIYRTEARSLLRFMSRGPISWDAHGVVYVNGEMIPGSNIVDIAHSIVRARKTERLPTGWNQVMSVLKEANVPMEYVGNPSAIRFLGVGLDTASSPWGATTPRATPTPRRTPMRDRLRPRFDRPPSPKPKAKRSIFSVEEEDALANWEPFS